MTFDLRKFERVWEKSGERPTFDGQELWFDDGACIWAVKHDYLRKETAAAIVRDWAVIRGGEKWGLNLVWAGRSFRTDQPDGWQVYCKQRLLAQHPDAIEALYVGWCSVLGIEP